MGKRRQSPADRLQRLATGSCPVHGIGMPQVSGWFEGYGDSSELDYALVQCPRQDREITAKAFSIDGPWELLRQWQYLLEQSETGGAKVLQFPSRAT